MSKNYPIEIKIKEDVAELIRGKRKKFQSQIKYEKENPAITFRMKKEEKERIVQMAKTTGKSVSEFNRTALLNQEKDFSECIEDKKKNEYNRGYATGKSDSNRDYNKGKSEGDQEGYKRGMNEWAIWVICEKCWKPKYIKPNSKDHENIQRWTRTGIKHDICPIG
jgi:hypothetical protein